MQTKKNGEQLLVDGYNLIRAAPELRHQEQTSLEQGRRALEQQLLRYHQETQTGITIFYDGDGSVNRAQTQQRQGLEIIFSQPPQIADDLIKKRLQEKHGAKWLRVISSDREIRRFARRHKIRSTASADFVEELEAPPAPSPKPLNDSKALSPEPLDRDGLANWVDLFQRQKPPTTPAVQSDQADRELDEWERQFNQGHPDDE